MEDERRAGKLAKGTRGQLVGKKPGTSKGRKGSTGGVSKTPPVAAPTLEARGIDKNLAHEVRYELTLLSPDVPPRGFEAWA
jgi:hypothetical protein